MIGVTGLGSLPGRDFAAAARLVLHDLPDLVPFPELPARGVGSDLVGRSLALMTGMSADLQPAGWRLTQHDGADLLRARAQWRRDLDDFEEQAQEFSGTIKLAIAGPWTMAALVERPRGDRVLADHGARRDLAESVAHGVRDLLDEMGRRLPRLTWRVQLDEPMLPLVMQGRVATASGFSKHRRVDAAVASELLGRSVAALSTAEPLLHSCAPGVDLEVVARAGVSQVALDAALLRRDDIDAVAAWLEAGRSVVWGVLPAQQIDQVPRPDQLADHWLSVIERVGGDLTARVKADLISPSCGLAGWSPAGVSRAVRCLRDVAGLIEERAG